MRSGHRLHDLFVRQLVEEAVGADEEPIVVGDVQGGAVELHVTGHRGVRREVVEAVVGAFAENEYAEMQSTA